MIDAPRQELTSRANLAGMRSSVLWTLPLTVGISAFLMYLGAGIYEAVLIGLTAAVVAHMIMATSGSVWSGIGAALLFSLNPFTLRLAAESLSIAAGVALASIGLAVIAIGSRNARNTVMFGLAFGAATAFWEPASYVFVATLLVSGMDLRRGALAVGAWAAAVAAWILGSLLATGELPILTIWGRGGRTTLALVIVGLLVAAGIFMFNSRVAAFLTATLGIVALIALSSRASLESLRNTGAASLGIPDWISLSALLAMVPVVLLGLATAWDHRKDPLVRILIGVLAGSALALSRGWFRAIPLAEAAYLPVVFSLLFGRGSMPAASSIDTDFDSRPIAVVATGLVIVTGLAIGLA